MCNCAFHPCSWDVLHLSLHAREAQSHWALLQTAIISNVWTRILSYCHPKLACSKQEPSFHAGATRRASAQPRSARSCATTTCVWATPSSSWTRMCAWRTPTKTPGTCTKRSSCAGFEPPTGPTCSPPRPSTGRSPRTGPTTSARLSWHLLPSLNVLTAANAAHMLFINPHASF